MIITDAKREDKRGNTHVGYYMDGYLKQNLDGIKYYLNKAWDVVGIVSGHGKVRIGKSTMAMQVGFYIAWFLAGGYHKMSEDGKKIVGVVRPNKPVRFDYENLVFSPDELKDRAHELYKKYGKNQVLVYDEGRAGLDSSRAMENVNKAMVDFFQECGMYGHIILIVLPNFFKLHEDYAIARSLFLIDVYADEKLDRGRFAFYNERQKEWLYFLGKKLIGVSAKYSSTWPNFRGRFGPWLPLDKDKYEALKVQALQKKRKRRLDTKHRYQRDVLIHYFINSEKYAHKEIVAGVSKYPEAEITEDVLQGGIHFVNRVLKRQLGIEMEES